MPFMAVLLLVTIIPLILASVVTWYLSSANAKTSIDNYSEVAKLTTRTLVNSKLTSIVDYQVEKFTNLYGSALKVIDSAVNQFLLYPDAYRGQIRPILEWDLTISDPFRFYLMYMTYECNGHLYGVGNAKDITFTSMKTHTYYQPNDPTNYTSLNGVVYGTDGCNTPDFNGETTKELREHEVWPVSDLDGLLKYALNDSHTNHDSTALYDARIRPWYISTKAEESCLWSSPYLYIEPPINPVGVTLAKKVFDSNNNFLGEVAIDLTLNEIQDFIENLISGMTKASAIILDKNNLVIAASDGDTVIETGDNAYSDLHTFESYASKESSAGNVRYKIVSDYIAATPGVLETLKTDNVVNLASITAYTPMKLNIGLASGDTLMVAGIYVTDPCALDYTVFIMMEESEFRGDIDQQQRAVEEDISLATRNTYFVIGPILVVVGIASVLLARVVSKPLEEMTNDIVKVTGLDFSGTFGNKSQVITELSRTADRYKTLKSSLIEFKAFVPPHIVGELVTHGSLDTQAIVSRHISFFFCDVANFTTAAQKAPAQESTRFASAFLGGTADLITEHGGTVVDFFGDQIFGIFNAPNADRKFATNTLNTAYKCLELFKEVKAQFVAATPAFSTIDLRIGLHSGEAMVGIVGSKSRLSIRIPKTRSICTAHCSGSP